MKLIRIPMKMADPDSPMKVVGFLNPEMIASAQKFTQPDGTVQVQVVLASGATMTVPGDIWAEVEAYEDQSQPKTEIADVWRKAFDDPD